MKKEFMKFPRHASVWNHLPNGERVAIGRRSGVRIGHAAYLDVNSDEYKQLVAKFGEDATKKMKEIGDATELRINQANEQRFAGLMKAEDFEKFKKEEMQKLNDKLAGMESDLKEKLRLQGEALNKLSSGNGKEEKKAITLKQFFDSKMDEIKDYRRKGAGFMEITSEDLIKAGVVSMNAGDRVSTKAAAAHSTLAGTIGGTDGSIVNMTSPPGSPYLPGLGGSDLELFDLIYNPNFILNRVDVGTTNQSRLAWLNEVEYQGTPGTAIAEGAVKPQVQHKFQVEYSVAKKAAAWIELTEEFEDDTPGLATAVRRMLQADVLRAFDDAIQAAVIAVAHPYEITGLDGVVPAATLFDTLGALLAQIGYYNFAPNTIALNPITSWLVQMGKGNDGHYLNPPFLSRINAMLVEANKVAVGFGLAGDLSQYKVDIYKQFTIRVGWINDEFIYNKFAIVGELRYHNYISDNRKKAIVYDELVDVQAQITSGS